MQYRVDFFFFLTLPTTAPPRRRGVGMMDGCLALPCLVIVAGAVTGAVNAATNQ